MKSRIRLLAVVAASVLLAACGGGGSDSATASKTSVSSVTTSLLAYRKTATITIAGQGLDQSLTVANAGCLTITELPGASATQRVFSCKMIRPGTVAMSITATDGSSLYAGTMTVPLPAQPQVTMVTSLGTMVFELDPAKAPVTVDNFLQYTETGFYSNKIFHRVEPTFVIQGGGLTADFQAGTTLPPIKLEVGTGLSNLRGSLAMAMSRSLLNAAG